MTFTIPRPDWVSDDLVAERGEHAGFQMFSRQGNDACALIVTDIAAGLEQAPQRREDIIARLQHGVRNVRKVHPEIFDTEPEWALVDAMNALLDIHGITHIGRDDLS